MALLERIYRIVLRKTPPYYYKYGLFKIMSKPIKKYITNVVASNCPFNTIRILLYKFCGFTIGKKCFIGMKCYLDDLCPECIIIGNNVTISYGVYFACHGPKQKHLPIVIKDNSYIGMRASIISKNSNRKNVGITIGKSSVIGACSLVNTDIPNNVTAVGVPCKIIEFQK